ncbi:hypothetical protein BJ085DRAFT_28266 [Dimargaris cristalligena]|uniref:F-box domain-containing protein n=1 Tax=Dimargaris cristalligena TaxID=215637 RepID=A0A4P9ZQL4_9FUNG|nr:hypothetical protein BJ085DRAFT_28266 [Dimargaris cristalligena]|eukprot:RKP35595.1 hypothetical protein BJ085DRAFT_28266 [Dimargaris cristalligena]
MFSSFSTHSFGPDGQPHPIYSPGLELLKVILNPANHLLGYQFIRYLHQEDQFHLAAVCRTLRPFVTSAYLIQLKFQGRGYLSDNLTQFIRRYHPRVYSLKLTNVGQAGVPSPNQLRLLFKQLSHLHTIEFNLPDLDSWSVFLNCLTSLAQPPRKFVVCSYLGFSTVRRSVQLDREQFSLEALHPLWHQLQDLALEIQTMDDGVIIQQLREIPTPRHLQPHIDSPGGLFHNIGQYRDPQYTDMLAILRWNCRLPYSHHLPYPQQLVSFSLCISQRLSQLGALRHITEDKYPYLADLTIHFESNPSPSPDEQKTLHQFFRRPWARLTTLHIAGNIRVPNLGLIIPQGFPNLRALTLIGPVDLAATTAQILSGYTKLQSLTVYDEGVRFMRQLVDLDFYSSTLPLVGLAIRLTKLRDLSTIFSRLPNLQEVHVHWSLRDDLPQIRNKYPRIVIRLLPRC